MRGKALISASLPLMSYLYLYPGVAGSDYLVNT